MAVATSSAAKLATNDFVRDKLTAITHGHLTIAGKHSPFNQNAICKTDNKPVDGLCGRSKSALCSPGEMAAGGIAGLANAILSSPLELLKLRLQVFK